MSRILILCWLTNISAAPINIQIVSGSVNLGFTNNPEESYSYLNLGVRGGSLVGRSAFSGAFQNLQSASSTFTVAPNIYVGQGPDLLGPSVTLQLDGESPVSFNHWGRFFGQLTAATATVTRGGPMNFVVPFAGQIQAMACQPPGSQVPCVDYLITAQGNISLTFFQDGPYVSFRSATVTFTDVPEPAGFILSGTAGLFLLLLGVSNVRFQEGVAPYLD